MAKLISIDLKADFGFLRKPDVNDGISLSYNMLHKPGLLGIFGAILGLAGYQKRGELPEYYQKLSTLKMGVAPLNDDNGNFSKTTIVYTNTVGYANKDGNFIASENTLIKPSYRVFVSLSETDMLYEYLKDSRAEYIPYMGKNEFPVWWECFQEYDLKPFDYDREYEVKTLFIKDDEESVKDHDQNKQTFSFSSMLSRFNKSFFYFERLPTGFREFDTKRGKEYQYAMAPFVYSNARFSADYRLKNLYVLNDNHVVQLN